MDSKIFFISEALSAPFDEGIKNITLSLYRQFNAKKNILTITKAQNNTDNLNVVKINLNKFFLNKQLFSLVKLYSPDVVIYLPFASCTFNSFVRARILKLINKRLKVAMIGVQHRRYSFVQGIVITRLLKPDLLFFLRNSDKDSFLKKYLKVRILQPAVDTSKFYPVTKKEKEKLRSKYNISDDKTLVLHVGHIKVDRNIECLLNVQKIDNVQVLIVGSTSMGKDSLLKNRLTEAGIQVIDETIPDVSEVYKMSDIYVFPVIRRTSAIDMPLSVIEALACNLPVITTRFDGLVDFFKEDFGFRYFDTTEELITLIRSIDRVDVHNSKKIENFTWDRFTNEIINACEELV